MQSGKRIRSIAACLILLLILTGPDAKAQATAGEETGAHRTTVLVYLCGGDLERLFGAATDDLREMAASGFDSRYTNLLIMAGDMRSRKTGPFAGKTAVIELGAHGMRTVWRSTEALNMADGDTLKAFLDYGYAQYPAQRYALILWGHGGGPEEGLFFDGQPGGDSLTLQEIRTALAGSFPAKEKLSWIGFDACLMATLETALAAEDYADVLIASQAREESSGWNYSFLRGLEKDADGEETGRRVVDAYFADDAAEEDIRTLSCIRLDRIDRVREEADRYAAAVIPPVTDERFPEFLEACRQVRSFGLTEDAEPKLLDLVSLSEAWEPVPGCGEALRAAVCAAVVCSEANREGANGLSISRPEQMKLLSR